MSLQEKLTFEERDPLQVMLGAVLGEGGAAATLERETGGTRLHVRGHDVVVEGPEAPLVARLLRQLYGMARAGNPVDGSDVGRALEVLRHDAEVELRDVFEDVILVRPSDGRGITARSLNQKRYVGSMRRHALTFGVGPAGTGKTYLAVAMAARALVDKQVRRIVLSRPAIEAGERLGFLPGTLEDKISPYLRPLYDALYEMFPPDKVLRMVEQTVLEIAPLAYMRGRTLNDAFVILDEAQNTTREQMKMFLTRIGANTKAVVTGDPSQVDLPTGQRSGLAHALKVLRGVDGIAVCRFAKGDVMRHPLVQAIIEAYDDDDRKRAAQVQGRNGNGNGDDAPRRRHRDDSSRGRSGAVEG
ncbi:PhoH family protein [Paraliomyxa miuraensis]|uniref:PhoH family protein n=1 Tax=Paraliomyxa miuraensis TaxID=376150 RepID=UPI0022570411|nr:PhoH family protein [Paraliomyxa miuraensis]MCX4245579.1 PhoH family protein [Paraliomyxa miuraensis]